MNPFFRFSHGVLVFFVLMAGIQGCSPSTAKHDDSGISPVNPKANKDVRRILNYLNDLKGHTENRIVSGQFVGHAATPGSEHLEKAYQALVLDVEQKAGKRIGMIGVDYAQLSEENPPVELSRTNQPLIDHWKKGGLVTVSWHARNPWTNGNSRDKEIKGEFADLLKEGTAVNARWMRELDTVAAALQELQKAGVSVLWRPLHESTSTAFWWSHGEPVEFRRVWKHMYAYFTEEKKLNNLLWVYSVSPKTELNPERLSEEVNYPGPKFVDITGLDHYGPDLSVIKESAKKLIKLKKPFGLTEYGPHKGSKKRPPPAQPYFAYDTLITQMEENLPEAVFFQAWNHAHSMAQQLNSDKLLNDPRVTDAENWKAAS